MKCPRTLDAFIFYRHVMSVDVLEWARYICKAEPSVTEQCREA